jgi:hypothetical protein
MGADIEAGILGEGSRRRVLSRSVEVDVCANKSMRDRSYSRTPALLASLPTPLLALSSRRRLVSTHDYLASDSATHLIPNLPCPSSSQLLGRLFILFLPFSSLACILPPILYHLYSTTTAATATSSFTSLSCEPDLDLDPNYNHHYNVHNIHPYSYSYSIQYLD